MINLRQLEAFRAVMISKTVTRAADMLYISQPAVTRLIADLERRIGFVLFERTKGRLYPTPEAIAFYEEVEKSFIGVDKIARVADEIREFRTGSLVIAGMPALSLGYLPDVIHRFMDAHPGITVSLQIRSSQKVAEWIAAQQCDLGLVSLAVNDPAIEHEPLLETRMVCVLPRDHRLAGRAVICPNDLADEVFISLGHEHNTRNKVDAVFSAHNVRRRLQIETQLSAAACDFVVAGAGLTLVEPITAALYQTRGEVVVKPFEPAIRFNFSVLYPALRPRSRIATKFASLLKDDLADKAREISA